MLDFWATWCGPCQMSMPSLEKLHKEYAPKGLQVLGMNVDEDPSVVEGFVRAMRTTYPVLLVGSSGVDAQYGVSGIPAFLLIDQDGGAVRSWVGFGPEFESEWRSAVDALLAEG
jgi:cytochrome c biogenesis protein CcmG/thiol:disulfide interchange protein DsbE